MFSDEMLGLEEAVLSEEPAEGILGADPTLPGFRQLTKGLSQ